MELTLHGKLAFRLQTKMLFGNYRLWASGSAPHSQRTSSTFCPSILLASILNIWFESMGCVISLAHVGNRALALLSNKVLFFLILLIEVRVERIYYFSVVHDYLYHCSIKHPYINPKVGLRLHCYFSFQYNDYPWLLNK